MALSIPSRKKPGKNSFPTSPEAVRSWLKNLEPIDNANTIRQLYRGLKHSNRLETSNSSRITVAEILEPAIFDALLILEEQYLDQCLPMPKKARHAHQLASEMFTELAFTHKIIVNDTYATLLPGQSNARSVGIYKALKSLSKLLEIHLKIRNSIPATILRDTNTMFGFATNSGLVHAVNDGSDESIDANWTIENVYTYIQLLALTAPYNQRRRQIPLLCRFLAEQTTLLAIETNEDFQIDDADTAESLTTLSACVFGIHLSQDSRPQPARYAEHTASSDFRYLNLKPLLEVLDLAIGTAPKHVSFLFESEKLSRSTLKEFKQTLLRTSQRQAARAITRQSVRAKTGLPEIASSLQYSPADIQVDKYMPFDVAASMDCWPKPVINQDQSWIVLNKNRYGACLEWRDEHITEAEIGDLVAWHMDTGDADTAWMIGTVRWLKLHSANKLMMGIEYYARSARSVTIDTTDEDNGPTSRSCLLTQNSVKNPNFDQRTLIAPAGVFKEKEHVRTRDDGAFQLIKKVSSTAACDFFEVSENQ